MCQWEETRAPGVRHPPHLLWAFALAAAALAMVGAIGALLVRRGAFRLDHHVAGLLDRGGVPAGPRGFTAAMVDVTALGGVTVLTAVTVAAILLLVTRRLYLTAALVAAATLSGSWIVTLVKGGVARARPDLVERLVDVSGMSFPSGHAANSAIVYLTLAALGSQIVRGRATRTALLAIAVLLVGAIGFSRVYLGVHWTSDVLAGWCFGTLWAGAWWTAGAWIRAHVRPAAAPTPARP